MYKIKKVKGGWIVLLNQPRWTIFGLKYKWIPFITFLGTDLPFLHESYELAMNNLLFEIKAKVKYEIY